MKKKKGEISTSWEYWNNLFHKMANHCMQSCMHVANLDKLILNSVNVTIFFKFTSSPENVIQLNKWNKCLLGSVYR